MLIPMPFQIAIMNVKFSNAPYAALAFKESLQSARPSCASVFCVQEMDRNAMRSSRMDAPLIVAQKDPYVFAETIRLSAHQMDPAPVEPDAKEYWSYGIGTFVSAGTRIQTTHILPLGPDESELWANTAKAGAYYPQSEPRKALFTEIAAGSSSLWCCHVHLAHTPDRTLHSDTRLAQINLIQDFIANRIPRHAPMVIAGDFNAVETNPDLAYFNENFTRAPVNVPTKITKMGPTRVDHIYYRGVLLAGAPRVTPVSFSDHSAVTCVFAARP